MKPEDSAVGGTEKHNAGSEDVLAALQRGGLHQPGAPLRIRLTRQPGRQDGYISIDEQGGPGSASASECSAPFDDLTFPVGAVDELALDQVLSAAPLDETLARLGRWCSWLSEGASLHLVVVDGGAIAERLLSGQSMRELAAATSALQGRGPAELRDLWTQSKLTLVLERFGFVVQTVAREQRDGRACLCVVAQQHAEQMGRAYAEIAERLAGEARGAQSDAPLARLEQALQQVGHKTASAGVAEVSPPAQRAASTASKSPAATESAGPSKEVAKLLRRGEVLFECGDVAAAISIFRQLVEEHDHAEAHNNLAVVLLGQGNTKLARNHLHRALDRDPNMRSALVNLYALNQRDSGDEQLKPRLERYLERHPDDEELRRMIGNESDGEAAPAQDWSSSHGPLWDPDKIGDNEEALLLQLKGKPICAQLQRVHVIGAHLFQEGKLLVEMLPKLQQVCLFEPQPKFYQHLSSIAGESKGVRVFPYAISDHDGTATFNITNNEASSSLLELGKHKELFPHVDAVARIEVQCRTLDSVIDSEKLPLPDFLFIDVQGAEYQVLSALSERLRGHVRLIYTEASLEEVYQGARPLSALRKLLHPDFTFLGFCALADHCRSHGNALFVRTSDLPLVGL